MRSDHCAGGLALAAALLVGGACSSTSPRATQAVLVLLKTNAATLHPRHYAAALEITHVRLVIRQAGLGNGAEFGCADCQGNGQGGNLKPAVVTVPLDGSPVSVAAERLAPGHYSAAEVVLVPPPPALLAATPDWPAGATIEVRGRYDGTDFTLPLAIPGRFRAALAPAIDVPAAGLPAPINVTITLPVASWFARNGTPLDPADAAARVQIASNARASITVENETARAGLER